jgi:YD repeat-containing protein
MVLSVRELGKTLFESADYAARGRDNHWYVYDLYWAYLLRAPDSGGWAYWESQVPSLGREAVRRAFDESGEFTTAVGTITAGGSASSTVTSLLTQRVEGINQPGNGLLSRDADWSLPLVHLPGRAGLDLQLTLSYSSAVWTRAGGTQTVYNYFDEDNGWPSPGFRLGFATIQEKFFNGQVGRNAYLLINPSGRRVELRQVGTSSVYDAADSSYMRLIDNGTELVVLSTDGSRMRYTKFESQWQCVEVKDRNGNFITINRNWHGHITTINDTLTDPATSSPSRKITFNYDSNDNLISITQVRNGQTYYWAQFFWDVITVQPSGFTGIVGAVSGVQIPALKSVRLPDNTYYKFLYTDWNSGQVSRITRYASDSIPATDSHPLNYTKFDYSLVDDPTRVATRKVWVENWSNLAIAGVPNEVETTISVDTQIGAHVMTAPDGTVYKEFYGTGWQRSLVVLSEVWSSGVKQRWTTTGWTQDNNSVNYETNPRLIETSVLTQPPTGPVNGRKTEIAYAQLGRPGEIKEYAIEGLNQTLLRKTEWSYLSWISELMDRRMCLPYRVTVKEGDGTLRSKTDFWYDGNLNDVTSPAVQHDPSYNMQFRLSGTPNTARGNVSQVRRYDVNDPFNESLGHTSQIGYDINGSVVYTTDASNHKTEVSYADQFSSDGETTANPSFSTLAYPTEVKDPDGFLTKSRYHYDIGAPTRLEGPPPAGQTQGLKQTRTYDSVGRLEWIRTLNNNAYTNFVYGPYYVMTYATVNTVAANPTNADHYSNRTFDGVGRVIGEASYHPNSQGGYKAQLFYYDKMGRRSFVFNPTEITGSWGPAGDDAVGWYYTTQTYDWNGRLLRTTHPDGTYTEASYTSCGCAGGEVVTLTDEGTIDAGTPKRRQQKIYSDILGRNWKTELLNWEGGTVYSATVNTYNARDQLTQVRQWAGPEGTGTYQDTTMEYDGYGRLWKRHVPEQNAGTNTVYEYFSDDRIQKVTDARGASTSYDYTGTNRHLVKKITYNAGASGAVVPGEANFNYDSAGNRTSMTDDLGSVSYQYNTLSQLTSESRTFNDPNNPTMNGVIRPLSYDYNLVGQLKSITDPFNATINYGYDVAGRLSNITGSNYLGVTQYASGMNYRAWGALKSGVVSTNLSLTYSYNPRLQITQFKLMQGALLGKQYQYDGPTFGNNDGRLKYAQDLRDDKLDRSYQYDQVGRVIDAKSGIEARRVVAPSSTSNYPLMDGPYNQQFGYDALDHLTSRTWRYYETHYTGAIMPSTTGANATYSNERYQGWQYDAAGNLTQPSPDTTWQYGYDAAGRRISATEPSRNSTFGFDGDGRRVRETLNGVLTYYVRSSVLDGAVVTELGNTGQKQTTYVYAGGKLLARQESARVVWEQSDPTGASTVWVDQNGTVTDRIERDPLGSQTGANGYIFYSWEEAFGTGSYNYYQYQQQMYAAMMSGAPGTTVPDSIANSYRACSFDGSTVDCNFAILLFKRNAAWQCPPEGCGPQFVFGLLAPYDSATGGEGGDPELPTGRPRDNIFGPVPQNPTMIPLGDLASNLSALLKKGDCLEYTTKLLAEAAKRFAGNQPHINTIMEGFNKINSQGGYVFKRDGYDSVRGDLFAGGSPGTVELLQSGGFPPSARDIARSQAVYAYKSLHETFHLGKQGGYSDEQMATAAYSLARKELDKRPDLKGFTRASHFSRIFDQELKKHCPYPK